MLTMSLSPDTRAARKKSCAGMKTDRALPFGKRAQKGAMQMDVYAIVTAKIINLLEQGWLCRGAGRGPRLDCRAIWYRKSRTTASTIFCFPRQNTCRPSG